jgi:amino acid adenylation domain-containing protein
MNDMPAFITPKGIVQEALKGDGALMPQLIGRESFQLLNKWQPTTAEPPCCIHQLFEAQVERAPERMAVTQPGESLSYGELNARANQLARHLRTVGVGPDALVAVAMPRAPEMIVAMLATLKAGGAYVPLDPAYPRERLAMMLDDARPVALITNQAIARELPGHAARVICMDADWPIIARQDAANLATHATPAHLAYIIYTSGSTGRPKGVMIEHRALSNFTRVAAAAYDIGPEDRLLQFASISFDASAEEIYPCLISGAALALRSEAIMASIKSFIEQCAAWRISVLDLPTAYWHELVERAIVERFELPASLRLVIIGGERALPDRVAAWQRAVGSRIRLVNTYGPTEATIVATACDLTETLDGDAPIGRAFANAETCILDADLQPVPAGDIGELHVGGAGLARGYLNQPALTATKFIPHPFANEPGARLYKTGDLARYRPDGLIEFCGRADHQVKVHGFRIELGEIESTIAGHPAVSECVMLVREEKAGDKCLIAYVVPAAKSGQSDSAMLAAELRAFLSDRLPHYMLPAGFVVLDRFPISANGKIDRKALPAPQPIRDGRCGSLVKPRDPLEHQLAQIWEELFALRPIGVTDSFFDLGGHSLLAVRMMDRMEQTLGKSLPLATLFAGATIEHLARALLNQEATNRCASVVEIQRGEGRRPFFYLHGDFNGGGLYCRSLARHLGNERPFYALQPHGLDGQPAPASIEDMAEYHLRALLGVQPEGPYMIGGHCNGGLIAFEMARRLEAAGERVALLALICTPGANTRFRALHRMSEAFCGLRRKAADERQDLFWQWRERAIRFEGRREYYAERVRAFSHSPIREQATFIRRHAKRSADAFFAALRNRAMSKRPGESLPAKNDTGNSATEARRAIGQAYERAMAAYVPGRYGGRVTLLWPEELPLEPVGDATCGWRKAAAEVDAHIVPGGHLTCITQYVEPLAARLKDCLDLT